LIAVGTDKCRIRRIWSCNRVSAPRRRDFFCSHSNPKVAFLIASAVQGKPQEVDRLWAFTATLASVSMREANKFNELGLHRFQGQTEFSQPFGKRFLSTESIRTKLETQHEVADISHHAGLAAKSPASISDSRVATPTGPLPHLNASKMSLRQLVPKNLAGPVC
jgi:hypothetical protein